MSSGDVMTVLTGVLTFYLESEASFSRAAVLRAAVSPIHMSELSW